MGRFSTKDFFWELEDKGIIFDKNIKNKISAQINNNLNYIPTVGFMGKTGVGKSSLCNSLFGREIAPINDVEACTRETKEIIINVGTNGIKLIDIPGVGESQERDTEYAALYNKLLPELDIILWVLKGDDRAFSVDEQFYNRVVRPHLDQNKPYFFVLNQIDKVEPFREWNIDKNSPGQRQSENINKKVAYVADCFNIPKSKVIGVSANENYNLVGLVEEIVFSLPNDKKITFANKVKEENLSDKAKEEAEKGFWETVDEIVTDVVKGTSFEPIYNAGRGLVKAGKAIFDFFFG